ncbi:LysR family transcriptional regulator [Frigidibacter sp. MR17.24]|uniref:LysR family transcriptional regulator n=1 Tax=Frigidibacter sp. MR17.24 TaxID=3127345 RepID=UPI003012F40C
MEMHQIRYFLAVSRLLNFTRAAEECHVTQPSLTRAIQKLEDEFGGPLFHRERAATHLTELGRQVQPHLQRTLDAAEAAAELAVSLGRAEIAPVTLGLVEGLTAAPLATVLRNLATAFPGLALDLKVAGSADLIGRAMAGELDLIVVEAAPDMPERLDTWPLYERRWSMVGPMPADAADDRATDGPVIGWSEAAQALEALGAQRAAPVGIAHRTDHLATARAMVAARLGQALLPAEALGPEDAAVPTGISGRIVMASVAGRRRARATEALVRIARASDWG